MELRRLALLGLMILSACGETIVTTTVSQPSTSSLPAGTLAVPALDPLGEGLGEVGIDRYRFRSTMIIDGDRPETAAYEGRVSVTSDSRWISASGIVGEFEVYLSPDHTFVRSAGGEWSEPAVNRVWQWPSSGPIADYGTAGTIARLAIDRGVDLCTEELLDGVPVTHVVSIATADLRVEAWISPVGVVRRVELIETGSGDEIHYEWVMYDINGAFVVSPPTVEQEPEEERRSHDRPTPQPD